MLSEERNARQIQGKRDFFTLQTTRHQNCEVFPTDGALKWDMGKIFPDGSGTCAAMPLLKASRNARIEALPFIPALIDFLHGRVQTTITAIEHAKEFTAKL